jgi:hypothetical protein
MKLVPSRISGSVLAGWRHALVAILAGSSFISWSCQGEVAKSAAVDSDGGSCAYPAGVVAETDAANSGCFAHVPGQICEVSNGATVLPDGGVSGGTESCHSLCGASEYEMTCQFTNTGPDPSLGCTVIPIPTPSCCLYYCCPCAE